MTTLYFKNIVILVKKIRGFKSSVSVLLATFQQNEMLAYCGSIVKQHAGMFFGVFDRCLLLSNVVYSFLHGSDFIITQTFQEEVGEGAEPYRHQLRRFW